MRTELVSGPAGASSWPLPSVCVRYGVAKPSVWLRRRVCKLPQFNNFRSDYPLNLSLFWRQYWNLLGKSSMRSFVVLLPEIVSPSSGLQRLASIVGHCSIDLASRHLDLIAGRKFGHQERNSSKPVRLSPATGR